MDGLVDHSELLEVQVRGAKQCKYNDCKAQAQYAGYCKPHYRSVYKHTSDGLNTNTGKPKLNAEQVMEIKRLHRNFKTNHFIAKQFGVSMDVIRRVVKGEYKTLEES